jgi:galactokinase/mevalonate kinase-like predicted kinase
VELNGQPPIQVFARRCEKHHIVMRSIDLGVEQHVTSYPELLAYDQVGSGFSIAKAAFCIAGFSPAFNGEGFATLEKQLQAFGGGIEVSLLAAIPKGSGLGASSVLAATLLGTLSELCGLNWDEVGICSKVLVLEQMLTTGGGWQDQVGGLVRGLKLIETKPGLQQTPMIRWLPEHLFTDPAACGCMLLYYTGITRVAKNILQEIVRGMFLNSQQHETTLHALGEHALVTYDSLVRDQWEALGQCIRRSWELNQQLDSGTNPPAIQSILNAIDDYVVGAKLLGAGGGGYLLIFAKAATAAVRIRKVLTQHRPNKQARFVDFRISAKGLEVTRS